MRSGLFGERYTPVFYHMSWTTCRGFQTTPLPKPYGFRDINPALVWVINPTPHSNLLRSISSITNLGGYKLGFAPDNGYVAVHQRPRVLHLRLQVLPRVLARATAGCI